MLASKRFYGKLPPMDGETVNADPLTASRWPVIDAARGGALAAMIIYHLVWDLSFFRYIDPATALQPGWAWFAKCIAASFLLLVGVGFALQARRPFNRAAWLKRLGVITLAALGVTAATMIAMPQAPVLFGILHCIAAASVLIVPFLRRPPMLALAAALVILLLPVLFRSPAFDGAALAWLGLNATPQRAVDHVPLLPWAGWTLLGFGAMRIVLTREPAAAVAESLARWQGRHAIARALIIAGRHSLAVYLLHQPLLIAALWIFAPDARAQDIRTGCERSCSARGDSAQACAASCGCIVAALQKQLAWVNILANRIGPDDQRMIDSVAARCRRAP